MQKVIVIGCPGSGKSTFARKLRDLTDLPLYYLDMMWHRPDKSTIARKEFDIRLREILSKDRWIIDGNYQRTLELRFSENNLPKIYELLEKHKKDTHTVIFKSRNEAADYLKRLSD